jgi:hypothetical protein
MKKASIRLPSHQLSHSDQPTDNTNPPPDLYRAIHEQLGLKLYATRAPAIVYIVDPVKAFGKLSCQPLLPASKYIGAVFASTSF